MAGKAVSLEEICVSSKFILLDTSAILGTYECLCNSNKIKIDCAKKSIGYFAEKMDIINNILVTEEIYSELSRFSFLSKYPKKNYPRDENNCAYIEIEFQREKQKLLEKIAIPGNIIKFSTKEKKLYENFYTKYRKKGKRYRLSDPDYSTAISAITCAKKEETVSIISNDNGIKRIWHDFVDLEQPFGEKINFFNHVAIGKFKKMRQHG
jgi:hypothetical protein